MSPDLSSTPETAGPHIGRDRGGAGITAVAVIVALLIGMVGIFDSAAGEAPQIGQLAPDFTAVDSKGGSVRLSEYRGNMQSVQALAQKNGIVWLTINSSAPGKQGYVNGDAADALTNSRQALPTPHMFVIDKDGELKYMGGIDSIASTDEADIAHAEPYLKEAMLAVAAGRAPPHPVTKPYGCSIKY